MVVYRNTLRAVAIAGALALPTLWASSAWAVPIDCDTGGVIQDELNGGSRLVEFTGSCVEIVDIPHSGTTIRGVSGNAALDVINGGVRAAGVQNILLDDLTITGISLIVVDGAYVTVTDSFIQNTQFGVNVFRGANIVFSNTNIGPVSGGVCRPICVYENSYALLTTTTVTGSASTPLVGGVVTVRDGSVAMFRGGNNITNNGTGPAVEVASGSTLRQDNPNFHGPDDFDGGLNVLGSSYADVSDASIPGDIKVGLHSVLNFGNAIVINGDITLSQDSALTLSSTQITVNGTLTCTDKESSVAAPGFPQGAFNVVGCTLF